MNQRLDQSPDWLARFRLVHPPAAARDHDPIFGPVFVRGAGASLWDIEGNDYIDLVCGYSAANFGQSFPPLVEAASRQLRELTHVTGQPHRTRIALAERLLDIFQWPRATSKVMFNVTGSRAIETAWKAAVAFRPGKIVTFGPAFHGRSLATLSLGQTVPLPPPNPFSLHVLAGDSAHYPYCAHCPLQLSYPGCNLQCVAQELQSISRRSEEISAVLVEPVIGARGMIFPPADFFQQLRHITQKHGILLIADEVQSGLGRFGHLSLALGQGWRPDLMVLGKSLGGGMAPISAVIGRRDVLDCLIIGSESETFAASPLASAVAMEVLAQLESGPWLERGATLGEELRKFSMQMLRQYELTDGSEIEDNSHSRLRTGETIPQGSSARGLASTVVEGEGACCVLEFGCHSKHRARKFAEACVRQRLLIQLTGPELTRVAMLPPLTMNDEELATTLTRLKSAFSDCVNFETKIP